MIAIHRISRRQVAGVVGAVGLLFLYACPPPPAAHNVNLRMCVVPFQGVPYNSDPPKIDGVVPNDLGWTNAFRYVFQNGTMTPDGAVQTLRGNDKLYMSIEVNHDDSFDAEDVIVIAFDPTGTARNLRMLHIFPF